jgi:hypothetical protein
VGPCPRWRRRVRLVVHLTGSFHQGFSARMQARGGGTPRAVHRRPAALPPTEAGEYGVQWCAAEGRARVGLLVPEPPRR